MMRRTVRGNLAVMERSLDPSLQRLDDDRDQVIVMHGVSWASYEALVRARGDARQPRMAYLDGTLQIMTTGVLHELDKTLLSRLLEAYADGAEVSLNGAGATTFRKKAKRVGLEPDECYWIGAITPVPDLALEIVHTNGGIDKLEIYRRLGVGEVWFWIDGRIRVYVLGQDGFHARTLSTALRGVDLDELARLCQASNYDRQTETVRAYRRAVARRHAK